MMKHLLLTIPLALATPLVPAAAVSTVPQAQPDEQWCTDNDYRDDRGRHNEIRELTVPAVGALITIDASPNGGIKVDGQARQDVQVRACVSATAASAEEARALAQRVEVAATAERVSATGPQQLDRRESWSVSYRVAVPNRTSMSLTTKNGGISISNVEGDITFQTNNGGVSLARLAGNVRGRTTNGGVDVDLDGSTWSGEGLDVETQNGGVRMAIPTNYSARLETGTINGRVNIDFPVNVQGRIDRHIETQLGSGGPPIKVRTSNGGVLIRRK
jgi:DUF4097 and DUF4098 domain-containing protein YvlB